MSMHKLTQIVISIKSLQFQIQNSNLLILLYKQNILCWTVLGHLYIQKVLSIAHTAGVKPEAGKKAYT